MEPLGRVLLTIVLLDVYGLEILWVLGVVEDSAKGLEAVGVVCKLRSASCVDNVPCVHYGIGYFLPVVPAIVVATWLRPRILVCRWLATSGAMDPCDFLILLNFFILLLQQLLSVTASEGKACLRYDCCGGSRPGAVK